MKTGPSRVRWWVWGAGLGALGVGAIVVAWLGLLGRVAPAATSTPPLAQVSPAGGGVILRLATYNVRNYNLINRMIDGEWKPNWPKPESEKTALRVVIRNAHPDILAMQEMGPGPELEELRRDLANEGLTYPYTAIVNGPDPDRHVAILSRVPPVSIVTHEKIPYKNGGKDDMVARGLLEVHFVTNGEPWTLFVVHLKSKLQETAADPKASAQRDAEARTLRDIIRQEQPLDRGALVAVVGDFNDSRDSPPVKRFLELDNKPLLRIAPAADSRGEVWTLTYPSADELDRGDFILLSSALAPWQKTPGGVVDIPETADASDHRLVWVDLTFPAPSSSGTASK
jgi:endonuclease/exonuclease/phosphatase family metal-dependent hydrolase